ncbi:fatty acyl-AMP ligase [Streptomyces rimosus]|uniref:fatty acyl-AMP ligase n=1 Tax=Streptomyces rimosus TaxID=1927 RepID=UPI00067B8112|nr:fatty acyl-AMP ligase [Streptomyces rimosus]
MQESFTAHVRTQVAKYRDERSYTFVRDGAEGLTSRRLGFLELDHDARRLASWLGAQPGAQRPVLLLYPEGLDFLRAFLGCLYAGVVAVPVPVPTDPGSLARTAGILKDTGAELVLTTSAHYPDLRQSLGAELPTGHLQVAVTDDGIPEHADSWTMPELTHDSVAFLQYTSGSTSEPKGVVVTHGNLLHNENEMRQQAATDNRMVLAGWLPHFHDMGLIGMLLHPLFVGGTCVYMAPSMFLRRPVRWLELITSWRATLTVAPDFAYELCARLVGERQLAGLDLSTLTAALNGAEPVRATTLRKFLDRFAPVGLRPDVFVPCYGMAEVTLMATGAPRSNPEHCYRADRLALERNTVRPSADGDGTELVSCGRAGSLELRIVDPERRTVLSPGEVGEIWLKGASVAAGYWNRPDVTEKIFRARTVDGDGPYLRTGDLGALVEGELYVTGRLKDVLIVHGRNLYPQDIEHAIRDLHPALAAGTGAVFPVENGREHVVIVHEIKKALLGGTGHDELVARIKALATKDFGLPRPGVVLANRGAVQRTTSGKVQRNLTRRLFLDGQLKTQYEDLPQAVRHLCRPPAAAPQAAAVPTSHAC